MSVKSMRMSKNLTQQDVATAVKVKRSTVSMWEQGKSIPRPPILLKLAKLFNCSVEELLK